MSQKHQKMISPGKNVCDSWWVRDVVFFEKQVGPKKGCLFKKKSVREECEEERQPFPQVTTSKVIRTLQAK